ncbi:cell division protein ZipA [Methylohalomonas lacus]|uniref:Cell division protein ZipA n=1 Tax=Methylohalomonas lacus TaxID=398773 RepID=A0AAE3HI02_9GAMM|nr:cell division protein ZipA C-terminal FtsZ-binding domain-containing protein [Methylohalomonas lacus]MCS3902706.1 cell division protein ZipA [Methylohalomonas lacus]
MDGLRWILLFIGLALVAGIYFFDRFKRQRRKWSEQFADDDAAAEFNMAPRPGDDAEDYSDALSGLNRAKQESHSDADLEATTGHASYADEEAIAEAEIGVRENAVSDDEAADTDGQAVTDERLIVFYLKAPSGQAFAGPGLFEALATAGMTLGEMGIYHDRNSHGDTIFSVANIFEPGTLDIDDPEHFSTRGVALFMQLPLAGNAMDEMDAFERMLGKAEIMAGRLGGELHDEQHQPLDDAGVARARAVLKPA